MADEYWKRKSLAEMDTSEWEQLCDGCALCCMHKLEDEDTGEVFYTDVACRLLDVESCRCTDYSRRVSIVRDCLVLSVDEPERFAWLPDSCAYKRLAKGRDLPAWHPLLTGDPDSVHAAGISVRGKAVSESELSAAEMQEFTVLQQMSDFDE